MHWAIVLALLVVVAVVVVEEIRIHCLRKGANQEKRAALWTAGQVLCCIGVCACKHGFPDAIAAVADARRAYAAVRDPFGYDGGDSSHDLYVDELEQIKEAKEALDAAIAALRELIVQHTPKQEEEIHE